MLKPYDRCDSKIVEDKGAVFNGKVETFFLRDVFVNGLAIDGFEGQCAVGKPETSGKKHVAGFLRKSHSTDNQHGGNDEEPFHGE